MKITRSKLRATPVQLYFFVKKKIFILKSVRIKQTTKSMLLTGFFFLQHHHCLQIVFKKVYRMRYAFKYTEIKNRQTCNI